MPSEDLKSFVTNLKFSNSSIDKIVKVAHAFNLSRDDDDEFLSSSEILKAAVALTENGFASSIHVMESGDSVFDSDSDGYDTHSWIEPKLKAVPKIYFDAAFLMDHFNKRPGKWIGELIDLQREAWFDKPWIDKDEAFAKIEESQREMCLTCGK